MTDTLFESLTTSFTPVVNSSFLQEEYLAINLSSSNLELDIDMLSRAQDHHAYLQNHLKQNNAKVGYGGYLEQRALYDRSDYFQAEDPLDKRNIHLGIDLWCEAGTQVHSPLAGTVHSFQINKNFGDYGPTIILQHTIKGQMFHTLYGHLSMNSLEGKSIGQTVEAGEVIASLGAPDVNGDYAPHLHFQIVIDMQSKHGDYPGVCSKNTLNFYRLNCLDPNLILKIY